MHFGNPCDIYLYLSDHKDGYIIIGMYSSISIDPQIYVASVSLDGEYAGTIKTVPIIILGTGQKPIP